MATKFKTLISAEQGVDFNKKEARNLQLQNLPSDPSSPVLGQQYFNTTTFKVRTYNGSIWEENGVGAGDVSQTAASSATDKMKVSAGANKTIKDYAGADGIVKTTGGVPSPATPGTDYVQPSELSSYQQTSQKDASGGYVGLTLFKINFKNALNTITSWFTNANTVARTYTFQDRDGTIADNTDITGAKARANHTGTQLANTISDLLSAIQGSLLTGLDAGTNAAISATDTLLAALAKLQNQITTLSNLDGVVLKGALATGVANMPAANAGDMYRITGSAGNIGGTSPIVKGGDTVYCIADGTASGTWAAQGANWVIQEGNIDDATETVKGVARFANGTEVLDLVTPIDVAISPYRLGQTLFNYGTIRAQTSGFATSATSYVIPFPDTINGFIGWQYAILDISVFEASTGEKIYPDIAGLGIEEGSLTITFGSAPAANAIKYTIFGY